MLFVVATYVVNEVNDDGEVIAMTKLIIFDDTFDTQQRYYANHYNNNIHIITTAAPPPTFAS